MSIIFIYKICGLGIYISGARLGAIRTPRPKQGSEETSHTINIVRRSYCRLLYGHVYGACTDMWLCMHTMALYGPVWCVCMVRAMYPLVRIAYRTGAYRALRTVVRTQDPLLCGDSRTCA